ncbi:fibrillarin-like rRNA/tRNA 2'-O-methyltransferase, partial [Candidatus Bathyarchaeota archaeon]|nr:fibrillarin-like rRNA/tRNA 2'-O-methyltransferase [Candidatus Bathyarchaeota archaeon]
GTTVSHVSDIVGSEGKVYAVDFSPRSLRELINNISSRINVFPILADARLPHSYRLFMENVDVVYCDIAQPEQAGILADNVDLFLRKGGSTLLVIKARSIDSTSEPEKVFKKEVNVLKRRRFNVRSVIPLEPYDKDHVMVLTKE